MPVQGTLSSGLPRLTVAGNRIVNADTLMPVRLRGINRSGLEYSSPEGPGSLANAGITEYDFDEMITGWGANLIRIPFNQDWAFARAGYDAEPYLAAMDQVIRWTAERGAYALLDLQWLDATSVRGHTSDRKPNFVAPLPNLDSVSLWRQLAARYQLEPAVLYDIFNEPHDPLQDDGNTLEGIRADGSLFVVDKRRVTMDVWQAWATHLIEAIRRQHADALIFVSGINWGYDLSGFPLADVRGLVYSTHVYPAKGNDWDKAFGDLADVYPVFAAELGGVEADIVWGESLLQYLDAREMGWAAWSWTDYPPLTSAAPPFEATAFGNLVRTSLRAVLFRMLDNPEPVV